GDPHWWTSSASPATLSVRASRHYGKRAWCTPCHTWAASSPRTRRRPSLATRRRRARGPDSVHIGAPSPGGAAPARIAASSGMGYRTDAASTSSPERLSCRYRHRIVATPSLTVIGRCRIHSSYSAITARHSTLSAVPHPAPAHSPSTPHTGPASDATATPP